MCLPLAAVLAVRLVGVDLRSHLMVPPRPAVSSPVGRDRLQTSEE